MFALAALAATASFAQSSVTLYGVLDAGIAKGTDSKTKFASGVNGGPRLGVKGTEDLGGGLSAVFQIETGLNNGKETAASLGDRGAFVGLAGGFGTVAIGSSVLTPSFYARAATDASTTNNYSIATFGGATRLDNSVNYTSPNWNGLTLRASLVQKNDNGGTKGVSDFSAVYANGPLTVAASSYDGGYADGKGNFVGASYNLGVASVFVNSVKAPGAAAVAAVAPNTTNGDSIANTIGSEAVAAVASAKYTNIGVSMPAGAWTFQFDHRQKKNANADTNVLSAQYALSKRTSLTAYTSKTEGAKSAVGAGIRHNF